MAGYYTVVQGDHVAAIAWRFGFSDFHSIWCHANNAELKEKRENPNVLHPGDTLFIPDRNQREFSCPTDAKHKFVAKKRSLKLRLTLRDQYEHPVANAPCVLIVDSDSFNLNSDCEGKVELTIPVMAKDCRLIVQNKEETAYGGLVIPLRIGHLDPVEDVSGQKARLTSLGYFFGQIDPSPSPAFDAAVEEFQCEHGLTVDGVCGPKTQAALKKAHGC